MTVVSLHLAVLFEQLVSALAVQPVARYRCDWRGGAVPYFLMDFFFFPLALDTRTTTVRSGHLHSER